MAVGVGIQAAHARQWSGMGAGGRFVCMSPKRKGLRLRDAMRVRAEQEAGKQEGGPLSRQSAGRDAIEDRAKERKKCWSDTDED